MMEYKIQLGDKVKDTITGFIGIAIARTEWITGCDRITVQPLVDKDGDLREVAVFDAPMLKVLVKKKKPVIKKKTGGPRMAVPKY